MILYVSRYFAVFVPYREHQNEEYGNPGMIAETEILFTEIVYFFGKQQKEL